MKCNRNKSNNLIRFEFKWHCKEGLTANISSLRVEFNTKNELDANRIFIHGPPASGKTYYGEQMAQFYNIPLITI